MFAGVNMVIMELLDSVEKGNKLYTINYALNLEKI